MLDLKRAVAEANALLDLCQGLSFERSLQPLHEVYPLVVAESLHEALFELFVTWGYERLEHATLPLTAIADWQAELCNMPLFWSGPWGAASGEQCLTVEGRSPGETPDHHALRELLLEKLASFVPPDTQAFRLAHSDNLGRRIEPRGGLTGPYLVLAWQAHAIVVGVAWDS